MPKLEKSSHKQGTEFRVLQKGAVFIAKHPRTLSAGAAVSTATAQFGPTATGATLAGTALAGLGFYRAAPRTWDRTVGPSVTAWRRRWTFYQRRWKRAMNGCDLSKLDKTTGEIMAPKLKKVKVRQSWDVLYVKMLPGQKPKDYEDVAEALGGVFLSERVAIQKIAPNKLALMVERRDPFGPGSEDIPASEIPTASDVVDLERLDVGSLEDGEAFLLGLKGGHLLVAGVTRAGKSGGVWNPLRAMGPAIRDQLVQVHAADLKGGAEMEPGVPLFASYSRGPQGCLRQLRHVCELMEQRKQQLREAGRRKFSLSHAEPFHVLMIDELMVMTALADNKTRMEAQRLLGLILTQGAGLGFSVAAYAQDPTTEGVPARKLFPNKIVLRVDAENHVDMVLGDQARERGALADKIPENQQGVGYVLLDGVREPRRFRFGLVTDDDIQELVTACAPEAETHIFAEPETAAAAA